jgi:nicotinamidase-related amidase
MRPAGGLVVFIQHDGPPGDTFEPETPGWRLLSSLEREPADRVVRKRACDAFYETDLPQVLDGHGVQPLIVTGCATDFCVDTTVRAALSRDYVDAVSVIRHHNWVWQNLIHPRARIRVIPASRVIEEIEARPG